MLNLSNRLQKVIENLSKDLNSGVKRFSENPLKYLAQVGLDYYDAAGAVAAGFAFCDTNNQVLGDSRVYVGFAGATLAVLGPCIAEIIEEGGLDLSYNPHSRASHRFQRNLSLGFSSLFFFWNNGKENVPISYDIITKGIASILLIPAYFEDRSRIKAPIQENLLQQYKREEKKLWEDADKKL
jgi:hypothetical protein